MPYFLRQKGRIVAHSWREPGDHPEVVQLKDGRYVLPTAQGVWYVTPGDWIVENGPVTQVYAPEPFAQLFKLSKNQPKPPTPRREGNPDKWKRCDFCTKEFYSPTGRGKYCSRACFQALRKPQKNREFTNEELLTAHAKHQTLRATANALGVTYEGVRQRLKKLGKRSEGKPWGKRKPWVPIVCRGCGEIFEVTPSRADLQLFHSQECYFAWRNREIHLEERQNRALEMLKAGMTLQKTADALGIPLQSLTNYIKKWKAEGRYPPTVMKTAQRVRWLREHEENHEKRPDPPGPI